MSDQNTYTQFGPDVPIEALNTDFSKCLPPNILTAKEQADCDKIVGSKASGSGFCSATNFGYDRMTYCACVNSAIPCPMLASAACANSANAYMPSKMLPTGAAFAECKDARICVNIVEVGGSQNIVSGITQECGAIQNVENIINTNPGSGRHRLYSHHHPRDPDRHAPRGLSHAPTPARLRSEYS
jgi:hypothetical protein